MIPIHCTLCFVSLNTYFLFPKSLSFKPQFFYVQQPCMKQYFICFICSKNIIKIGNLRYLFSLFQKKNRSLLQTFDNAIPLYWNANFITNKVTVLCIYVAFPHVSLGVLECMHDNQWEFATVWWSVLILWKLNLTLNQTKAFLCIIR